MSIASPHIASQTSSATIPRIAFVGIGWIGLHRLKSLAATESVHIAALADACTDTIARAREWAPGAREYTNSEALPLSEIDGVVIATPNALHAEQCLAALDAGKAVFCQKPLGRNFNETSGVIEAARRANRLLGVDFSYRHLAGMQPLRRLIHAHAIGDIYAVHAVFHNAYGPDKSWFYDPALAGGGCVLDLGIHLLDLILWPLDFPPVTEVRSRLFARGRPLHGRSLEVEDYAVVQMELDKRITASLSCSWNLPLGCDAQIELTFFGTKGGVSIRNVNGSFFDFITERFHGTSREVLHTPPDEWGGRALIHWAQRLAVSNQFDPSIQHAAAVSELIDRIYENS